MATTRGKYAYPMSGSHMPANQQISQDIDGHIQNEGPKIAVDFDPGAGNYNAKALAITSGTWHKLGCGWYGCFSGVLQGDDGYWYLYAHMRENLQAEGAKVNPGDIVGTIGSEIGYGGTSTGPHLHIGFGKSRATAVGDNENPMWRGIFEKIIKGIDPGKNPNPDNAIGSVANLVDDSNQGINTMPKGLPSIVPSQVVYVMNGKTDPENFSNLFPVSHGYSGSAQGNVSIKQDGHVDKLLFINHSGNVVGEVEINQDVQKGQIFNIDFGYSLQKYVDCSILTPDDAKNLIEWMTDYALGWKDDGTSARDSYEKLKNWYNSHCSQPSTRAASVATAEQIALAKKLKEGSFDDNAVIAIVANATKESSCIPTRIEGDRQMSFEQAAAQGGIGIGLFQWTNPHPGKGRASDLIDYCNNIAHKDPRSLEGQIEFLKFELAQKYQDVNRYLHEDHTVDEKVNYFTRHFEVPANIDQAVADRQTEAHKIDSTLRGDMKDIEPGAYTYQDGTQAAANEPRQVINCDLIFIRR